MITCRCLIVLWSVQAHLSELLRHVECLEANAGHCCYLTTVFWTSAEKTYANLCDVRKAMFQIFKGSPQPPQEPFKVHVWYYLLCDVFAPCPQAKSQQDKRMWILHLKRLILENHPAKIPAKVRAARLLTAPSLFTDGVNTGFEWDVLEMSFPLASFLSPSSPSLFPPVFFSSLSFYAL